MKLNYLIKDNRERLQFIGGLFLVILIPLLIIINTIFIINKYNESIDLILKKQALSIGRTISDLMQGDLPWEYFIQAKIDLLMESDIEMQEILVMLPEKNAFKIIASSGKKDIGDLNKAYYYKLAWLKERGQGLSSNSEELQKTQDKIIFLEKYGAKDRFWLVAMPMYNATGEKTALLSLKLSSEVVYNLAGYTRNLSMAILICTIFITILLLFVVFRLWDYVALYKKIKEVDKLKDEFISMASHELKAPILAIKGYLEMIMEGCSAKLDDKTKKSLKIMNGAAGRLSDLVNDLLEVGRIEQGKVKIEKQQIDIKVVIEEVVEELGLEAEKKKLNLDYKIPGGLPVILLDPKRFKQALVNIVNNAIKYTNDGEVVISARTRFDKGAIEINVKDTGIGMDFAERRHLFERFYRVKNEKTKKIKGTGLGLWITKELVEAMDGRINIDSIKDLGTEVIMQFPIEKEKKK